MKERTIIPHGNEFKKIRELQEKICKESGSIPIFPIMVRMESGFSGMETRSCSVEGISTEGRFVYLDAKIGSDPDKCENGFFKGRIKIAMKRQGFFSGNERAGEAFKADLPIKFPVFKVAETEFTDSDTDENEENEEYSTEWKILNEKWVKAK